MNPADVSAPTTQPIPQKNPADVSAPPTQSMTQMNPADVSAPPTQSMPQQRPQPRPLPHGVVRACSGVLESVSTEPYASYARIAEEAITCVRGGAERQRALLAAAIRLNLINRRENSYEVLSRRFGLPVSCSTFKREKLRYLHRFAELCGFI